MSERGLTILCGECCKVETPQWRNVTHKRKKQTSRIYHNPQHLTNNYPNVITTVYHYNISYCVVNGKMQW